MWGLLFFFGVSVFAQDLDVTQVVAVAPVKCYQTCKMVKIRIEGISATDPTKFKGWILKDITNKQLEFCAFGPTCPNGDNIWSQVKGAGKCKPKEKAFTFLVHADLTCDDTDFPQEGGALGRVISEYYPNKRCICVLPSD